MASMRICSLLPSSTEIVFALGLGDRLAGVTHECDFPAEAASIPAVTRSLIDHSESSSAEIHRHVSEAVHAGSSIYGLDQALLERIDPGLVLTQELCDVCAVSYGEVQRAVRLLPSDGGNERTVLSLEPTTLGGVLDTITSVGEAAGAVERAVEVTAALRRRIDAAEAAAAGAGRRPRVFAMEWLDPPFVGGHWVPEMIRLAGGSDGLGRAGQPSVQATWADIAAYDPEVVVLMPCGYHLEACLDEFRETPMPPEWEGLTAVKSGEVYVVDGSSFYNRPGPRVVDGLEILAEILHPEIFPRAHPESDWRRVGG